MSGPYALGRLDGTIAERSRIVALIREKADEWTPPKTAHYNAAGRRKAATAHELATLIEKEEKKDV